MRQRFPNFREGDLFGGGELAAFKALLEDVDVRGHLITLDVLHSTFEIEQRIIDRHGADYLFTINKGCADRADQLCCFNRGPRVSGAPLPLVVE